MAGHRAQHQRRVRLHRRLVRTGGRPRRQGPSAPSMSPSRTRGRRHPHRHARRGRRCRRLDGGQPLGKGDARPDATTTATTAVPADDGRTTTPRRARPGRRSPARRPPPARCGPTGIGRGPDHDEPRRPFDDDDHHDPAVRRARAAALPSTSPPHRGGRRGPPGVGVTISGTGYRTADGGQALVLIASSPVAQRDEADCSTVYFVMEGRRLGSASPGPDGVVRRTGLSVPGDTRPGRHTVSSSCRSSGVPVLASAEFAVTEASLHRTAFVTSLPGPGPGRLLTGQVLLQRAGRGRPPRCSSPSRPSCSTPPWRSTTTRSGAGSISSPAAGRWAAPGTRSSSPRFLLLSGPLWFAMQSSSRLRRGDRGGRPRPEHRHRGLRHRVRRPHAPPRPPPRRAPARDWSPSPAPSC